MSADAAEAQRIVAVHAWALGWPGDPAGIDPVPVAGQACGRLAASRHVWRSREWVLTEAAHEADACADPATADAIRALIAHHAAAARPRRGSCPDEALRAVLDRIGAPA